MIEEIESILVIYERQLELQKKELEKLEELVKMGEIENYKLVEHMMFVERLKGGTDMCRLLLGRVS